MTLRRPALSVLMSVLLAAAALVALSSPASAGDPLTDVKVNEVESSGGVPGDWIELKNTSGTPTDVGGLRLKDNTDANATYVFPSPTVVPAGGYVVVDEAQLGFGLGSADTARLQSADGTTLLDSYAWTAHATATYGRCPDGTGAFGQTASTKGAVNDCPPVGIQAIRFNEVGVQRRPDRRLGRADEHQPRPGRRGRAEVQGRRRHPRLLLDPRGHHDRAGRLPRPERGGVRLRARERRVRPAVHQRRGVPAHQLLLDRARGHDLRPLPRRHRRVHHDRRVDEGHREQLRSARPDQRGRERRWVAG